MLHTAPVQLTERCTEEHLDHQGETVLHFTCNLPQIHRLSTRAQDRINRYYRHLEQSVQKACRTRLRAQASAAAELAHANALPFMPLEAALTWETTYLSDDLWSLTWVWHVADGQTPLVFQWRGEVWDLRTGLPCPLERFAPKKRRQPSVLTRARRAAREQKRRGPAAKAAAFPLPSLKRNCSVFGPLCPIPGAKRIFSAFPFPFPPKHFGFVDISATPPLPFSLVFPYNVCVLFSEL